MLTQAATFKLWKTELTSAKTMEDLFTSLDNAEADGEDFIAFAKFLEVADAEQVTCFLSAGDAIVQHFEDRVSA